MVALLLIILTSLLTTGIIVKVKSFSSGRKGPSVFQPVKVAGVLFRKGIVYSETSGIITRLAPVIVFIAMFIICLMIPVAGFAPVFSFKGDFILFGYLLALSRFMMIIASFDTGSSFEGMGASREALYGMLIEPAMFILLAALVLFTGHLSLATMFDLSENKNFNLVYGLIIAYILGNITIVENSRIPVDDPKTHLELTMIHEVMVLDTSGFNLALIQLASFLKFSIFGSLMASALIPWELPATIRIVLYLGIESALAGVLGLVESFRSRFRMNRNQQFILTVSLISVLLFVVILFTKSIF